MGNLTKNKKYWISLLKFISIFGVFLGHYFGLIKYSNSIDILNSRVEKFIKYFNVLFNESFYMLIFCFISGYLVYNYIDRINSIITLIKTILLRYLRLLFPLLLCTVFIYSTYSFFGINSSILSNIFKNKWIEGNSDFGFVSLFISCFRTIIVSDSTLASPLWMLSYIYRTNLLIYTYVYILTKNNNRLITISSLLLFVMISVLFNGKSIGLIMWVGFLYAMFEKKISSILLNLSINHSVCIIIILLFYDIISVFRDMSFIRLLSATYITILFSKIELSDSIKLLKKDFSYIFYIIHFPFIVSFAGFIIKKTNIDNIYINIFLPLLPTLCLCILFSILIDYIYNMLFYILKYKVFKI